MIKDKKNRRRMIVMILSVAAIVVCIVVSIAHLTNPEAVSSNASSMTTPPANSVTQQNTAAPPPRVTSTGLRPVEQPASPAQLGDSVKPTDFFGLQMTLHPNEWEVFVDPQNPARMFAVRKSSCEADNKTRCPGFVVVNTQMPNSSKLMPHEAGPCYDDGLHDGGLESYGPPIKVDGDPAAVIGGKQVSYAVHNRAGCNEVAAEQEYETMHVWSTDGLVIFDNDQGSIKPVEGLVESFPYATWRR